MPPGRLLDMVSHKKRPMAILCETPMRVWGHKVMTLPMCSGSILVTKKCSHVLDVLAKMRMRTVTKEILSLLIIQSVVGLEIN